MVYKILFRSVHRNPSCGVLDIASGIPTYGCLVCDFFRWCIFEGYLYKPYGRYDIDSVPVSKLPELIHETKKDLDQVGLVSTVIGHVGDRNFHAMLVFSTDEELEISQKAAHRLVHRAIKMDRTVSEAAAARRRHYVNFLDYR